MAVTVTPSISDVYSALRALLQIVVPVGTEVIRGLGNRVPEPAAPFVAMTLITEHRLTTNIVEYDDPGSGIGMKAIEYQVQLMMQLDFYGPLSAEWSAATSALFRDEFACTALAPVCQPLYADDGQMMPLINGEEEYEERWMVGGNLQWNPILTTPQQFSDTLSVDLVNVEVEFPS